MTNSQHENSGNIPEEYSNPKTLVKHKQLERKIRKKRKKISRLKAFSRFVVLVILLVLTYEFFRLSGWYLKPDTFKSPQKNVEILNNNIIPTYVLQKDLEKVKVSHLPIFLVQVKPISKELYKNPAIKRVYVRRYAFPARLQIIVEERIPEVIIKTDLKAKPVSYFTSDGILIMNKPYMSLGKSSSALKILTQNNNLKTIDTKRIEELKKVVKAVEKYSNEKVEYIDLRKPNDVFVKIKTTSIRLGTLDSTVFERISRIYTILPEITEVDSHVQYIDLSWDKVNYFKLNKSGKNDQ
jgi:cell division septal protein FtsQ